MAKHQMYPQWVFQVSLAHSLWQCALTIPYALAGLRRRAFPEPDPLLTACTLGAFQLYIAFDTIWHWRKLSFSMKAHHLLTGGCAFVNMMSGPRYLGLLLLTNESSTIFLNLKKLQPECRAWQYIFRTTFILSRVVCNGFLLGHIMHHAPNMTAPMCCILGLNLFWVGKLCARTCSNKEARE